MYAPTVIYSSNAHLEVSISTKRIYLRQRYRHYRTWGYAIWEARAYAEVDFSRRHRYSVGTTITYPLGRDAWSSTSTTETPTQGDSA